jgi:hypothetical protein
LHLSEVCAVVLLYFTCDKSTIFYVLFLICINNY